MHTFRIRYKDVVYNAVVATCDIGKFVHMLEESPIVVEYRVLNEYKRALGFGDCSKWID